MGKFKKKKHEGRFTYIHAYSGIFRHIQAYLEPCLTMVYSEPWYIQNQTRIRNIGIFRTRIIFKTLSYLETEAYSRPCKASVMEHFAKRVDVLFLQIIVIFAMSAFHVLYSSWNKFQSVWAIRPAAPGPKNFFNQLNLLLLKVQSLWSCAHYFQWLMGYLNHVHLLLPHVHVLKKLPYCLMCT